MLAAWAVLFPAQLLGGDPPKAHAAGVETLGSVFPGVELVRWQGREARVVLRRAGKLTVVHPGESLPDAGLLLRSASEHRLVFETLQAKTGPGGARLPEAVVVLVRREDETVASQVFRRTPPEGSFLPLAARGGVAVGGGTAQASTAEEVEPAPAPVEANHH